ncbi:MAG: methyltransferase domain-containing protein [Gammaproteobacteria bacterium]
MLVAVMNSPPGMLKFRDLQRRFDRAAASFDEVDFVHRRTADGLMDRLDLMLIDAKWILDIGGATGSASRHLCQRFKRGRVIVLDASHEMLQQAKKKQTWFSRVFGLQANALALPVRTGSVDLVFSNLLLPWIDDLRAMFTEVTRVLRKGGLFVFSTLGPPSLSELREAWATVDNYAHVNRFADMHDIGDGLVHAGLRDPVLDTDFLNVSYRDTAALFRDLTLSGGRNSLADRAKTLTGKGRFRNMDRQLSSRFRGGLLEFRLEIVYGHAWGGGPRPAAGEYLIEAAQIERRQR